MSKNPRTALGSWAERGLLNGFSRVVKVVSERRAMQIALVIFNFGKKDDKPKKKSSSDK